ncbi:GIY-YIG nuclease family protein [Cohnella candidum]|uniref:GIY-YIG nuclease family protein n=1 Tax=Cohnella candidum TaxID=2674991 RepID=A0A3G3K198_9BACL|nr:GIY-YIG nuclease family protein [Cohnella candidum]AYQ74324.1 GIY-YIG nuclease family protein [Cohnella candidum]
MTIEKQRKKELSNAFAQSFRPMGIFQIRNLENGKIFVGSAMDLNGMRNRVTFMGGLEPPFHELKEDWRKYGGGRFVFEVLDELKPLEDAQPTPEELAKCRKELEGLLELWLEKLQPYGDQGYNKQKTKS